MRKRKTPREVPRSDWVINLVSQLGTLHRRETVGKGDSLSPHPLTRLQFFLVKHTGQVKTFRLWKKQLGKQIKITASDKNQYDRSSAQLLPLWGWRAARGEGFGNKLLVSLWFASARGHRSVHATVSFSSSQGPASILKRQNDRGEGCCLAANCGW